VSDRPNLEDEIREVLRPVVVDVVAEELDRLARQTEWLTVEEYAQRRRTTPAAVHKRLERGQIPDAVRDGKRWLIPLTATLSEPENEGRAPLSRPRPGTER
jgi:hypothetical protein